MDDLNGEHLETDEQFEVLFLDGEEGTSSPQDDEEIGEQSVNDNSLTRISSHEKDVFCMSLSKNGRLLATGSQVIAK